MINEEMLKTAAAEANLSILDTLPAAEEYTHTFSFAFERKMRRLLRRERHRVAYRFLSRAACFTAAVALAGATWLAVDVRARADFFSWIKENVDSYVAYRFVGDADKANDADQYSLTWLPEGFALVKQMGDEKFFSQIYANAEDQMISFMCSQGTDAMGLFIGGDSEPVREVMVGETLADFYKATEADSANALIWLSEDGEMIFCISAPLPEETMIQIAESAVRES